MTHEPDLDAFDRDLQALLRVEPSPDFMAGVRARIEQAPPARSAWWWLAPALAAGVAALLLARAATRTAPAPPETPRAIAAAPPRPGPPLSPAGAPAPLARLTAPRPRRAPAPPEVIVPPDGERALLAFVAAANARGARRVAPLTASTAADEPLAPPAPIDIAPLETPPLPDPAGPPARSDS